jgi:hypothetical protein
MGVAAGVVHLAQCPSVIAPYDFCALKDDPLRRRHSRRKRTLASNFRVPSRMSARTGGNTPPSAPVSHEGDVDWLSVAGWLHHQLGVGDEA